MRMDELVLWRLEQPILARRLINGRWYVRTLISKTMLSNDEFHALYEPADAPSEIEALRRENERLRSQMARVKTMFNDTPENPIAMIERMDAERDTLRREVNVLKLTVQNLAGYIAITGDYAGYSVREIIEEYRALAEAEIQKEGKE